MDADVVVSGGKNGEELTDLWEWIRGERVLAGSVRLLRRPSREDELGSAFDTLAVAVGSGGAITALAGSLTAWLKTRRADVAVSITTEAGTVSLHVSDAASDLVLPLLQHVLPVSDD